MSSPGSDEPPAQGAHRVDPARSAFWISLLVGAALPVATIVFVLSDYLPDFPSSLLWWVLAAFWFSPLVVAIAVGAMPDSPLRRSQGWGFFYGWLISIVLSAVLVWLYWTAACGGSTSGYFC